MNQKRKDFIIMILLTVFMIAIAVSSCETKSKLGVTEQYFPPRVGSGIR